MVDGAGEVVVVYTVENKQHVHDNIQVLNASSLDSDVDYCEYSVIFKKCLTINITREVSVTLVL